MFSINPEKILYLDIETVPAFENYNAMPERFRLCWDKKAALLAKKQNEEDETPESIFNRAGIYAEFGKIVCISVCMFHKERLRVKSYYGNDEAALLLEFADMLHKSKSGRKIAYLCAHNGKEFDFPYIGRRMVVHGIPVPDLLECRNKKPWEVPLLDTMDLWRFADRKDYTSLETLTTLFNLPSSKDDLTGAEVYECYYQQKDLERIKKYCQQDAVAVARLMMKYQNLPDIAEENIDYV